MLKFYKLTERHLKKVQKFTKNSEYPFCDYSVGVIFTWYYKFKAKYTIFDDTLIVKMGSKEPRFLMPIGKNVKGAIQEIENYCKQKRLPLKFISVSEKGLEYLSSKYEGRLKSRFNRDYSDYVYSYDEMLYFKGKKFNGQRNHINSFKKQYNEYMVNSISGVPKKDINIFFKEYKKQYANMKNSEKKEFKYTKKLLKFTSKCDLIGVALKLNDKIVGLSIGEYVGNMLVIHVEKALTKYKGVYPTLYNEFVKFAKKDGILFINREDDSGDQGLRTSKTQYKPIEIINKNVVDIKIL